MKRLVGMVVALLLAVTLSWGAGGGVCAQACSWGLSNCVCSQYGICGGVDEWDGETIKAKAADCWGSYTYCNSGCPDPLTY